MSKWTPVLVESPYGSEDDTVVAANEAYARAAYHDCLMHRDEAPFASHLNYTQPGVLDDRDPHERVAGINAGLAFGKLTTKSVFYIDRGFSRGMRYGLAAALEANRPIEFRAFSPDPEGHSVTVDLATTVENLMELIPGMVSTTLDVIDMAMEHDLADKLQQMLIVNNDARAGTMSAGCP